MAVGLFPRLAIDIPHHQASSTIWGDHIDIHVHFGVLGYNLLHGHGAHPLRRLLPQQELRKDGRQ